MNGLFYADAAIFGAASLGGIGSIYVQHRLPRGVARGGWLAGTLWTLGTLAAIGIQTRRFPSANLSETLLCLVLAISVATFVLERWLDAESLHSFMLPLTFILTAAAALAVRSGREWGPGGAVALIHGGASILGFAAFATAFLAAAMYVVQEALLRSKRSGALLHALPPLERLDRIYYRSVVFGFPFFTLAFLAGVRQARERWGDAWLGEPVVLGSLLAWGIYAALLWMQMGARWHGRRGAWWVIAGFIVGLASLLATGAMGGAH